MAILYVNLVNFGPVRLSPEFNIGEGVHPVVSLFKINLSDKLCQDSPDRFSPNVHRVYGRHLIVDYRFDPPYRSLNDVTLASNFRVKIGEIGRLTFICRLGILKTEWNIAIPISTGSSAMIWLHCELRRVFVGLRHFAKFG